MLPLPLPTNEILQHFSEAAIDSAMFLLLGVSIGVYITSAGQTLYESLLSQMIINTLVSCLIVFILVAERKVVIKRFFRLAICLSLSLVLIAYVINFDQSIVAYTDRNTVIGLKETECFIDALEKQLRYEVIEYIPLVLCILYFCFLLVFILFSNPWMEGPIEIFWKKIWFSYLATPFVIFQISIVWLMIAVIFILRDIMKKTAGTTWQEAEWSFGQVIAIVTWIPIVWIFGEEFLVYLLGITHQLL